MKLFFSAEVGAHEHTLGRLRVPAGREALTLSESSDSESSDHGSRGAALLKPCSHFNLCLLKLFPRGNPL